MTRSLFDRIVVPVASESDAVDTARALAPYTDDIGHLTVVHVIEKAGGAPDKAGVEQREGAASKTFDAFAETLSAVEAETRTVFHTDVVDGILQAAAETDASAVAFTPRTGGRIVRFLSGDVTLSLVTEAPLPVVSLPLPDDGEGA